MEKQTENDVLKSEHKNKDHHEQRKKKMATKNPFTNVEVLFLVVVTAIVSILMTYIFVSASYLKEKTNQKDSKDAALQEFIDTYQNVIDSYYEDVDEQELIDNAIKGMLSGLDDPYSTYLDENTSSNFDATLAGTYQGVGLEVYNDNDMNVVVSRVFDNSSADAAGIQAGDIIKKIDNIQIIIFFIFIFLIITFKILLCNILSYFLFIC